MGVMVISLQYEIQKSGDSIKNLVISFLEYGAGAKADKSMI